MSWHPNLTRPCGPDCACGKHNRSKDHNERIGMAVRRTLEKKKALEKIVRVVRQSVPSEAWAEIQARIAAD